AFAEEMGRRGLRPAIPLLVLTADGRAEQKAARIGAEGYLEKPFDVAALLAEVDRLLA
nr:response regulator [Geodermatophilaceae bacterium]